MVTYSDVALYLCLCESLTFIKTTHFMFSVCVCVCACVRARARAFACVPTCLSADPCGHMV